MKRTEKEIQAEIEALKGCKAYAPHYSFFGSDNHHNLDVQIEFLLGEIDESSEEFTEDFDEDEQSSILEAARWRDGDSSESASSGWDYLNPK